MGGASGGGLNRITRRRFDVISESVGNLPSRNLSCLLEDTEGTLWFGSFGSGIYRRDGEAWVNVPIDTLDPNSGSVTSLCQSVDGDLWFTLFSGYYGRYREGKFLREGQVERSRGLCPHPKGGVWLGSSKGVYRLQDGEIMDHFHEGNGLSNNDVQSLTTDPKGTLWVSTQGGLNRLEQSTWTSFGPQDGLGVPSLRYVYAGKDGSLWIATGGAGLACYRDGTFARVTAKEGLPSEFPTCMLEDAEGNLWIGTANGLAKAPLSRIYDCLAGRTRFVNFETFGKPDGLEVPTFGTGFHPPCTQRRSDGSLWFTAGNQLAIFYPGRIPSKAPPPAISIDHVLIDGESIAEPTRLPKSLRIPSNHQRLTFHYAAIHLAAPERITYRVQLSGYDSDWVMAYGDREATYTQVPPGQYQFRVMAADVRGNWNEQAAEIQLTVEPAWWQTRWAKWATVFLLAGLLAGAYQWRRLQWQRDLTFSH